MKYEPWILSTDEPGYSSPPAGSKECFCSRCRQLIGIHDVPVRAWPLDHQYELRYHPGCLGLKVVDPPLDPPVPPL